MKKIIITLIFAIIAVITISCITFANSKEFKYPDLSYTTIDRYGKEVIMVHPNVREIEKATAIGIMEGYPPTEEDKKQNNYKGKFKPDEPIKRSEFIKSLICLATNRSFDFDSIDSQYSDWYGPYVTIAETQEIIEKNQYTPEQLEESITRLEMILMLSKTQIKMKGIPQTQMGTLIYTDIGRLNKEEKDLVLHAVNYDLLDGMKDGVETTLQPYKYLTRGEAAAALMRIY